MGLDSVELVMEMEKYFAIQIPDPEAEKIFTVQNMVDTVAKHLNISDNNKLLRDTVFHDIRRVLAKPDLATSQFELTDLISAYLPLDNKSDWMVFKKELGLEIPKPDVISEDKKNILAKIKSAITWKPNYDWWTITVDEFVTAVCANNYDKLLDNKNIKSTYEIYVAVIGITVDKTGVDYFEITPEKSFTSDLGVD